MTVGNLFCVASLVCCLLLNCLDYHAEKLRLDADGSCNSVARDDELDDDKPLGGFHWLIDLDRTLADKARIQVLAALVDLTAYRLAPGSP